MGRGRVQVEHYGEEEYEDCDGEVDPLDVSDGLGAVFSFEEEDVTSKDWSDDCANAVEGLGEIYSHFCVARWSTYYRAVSGLGPAKMVDN